MVVQEDREEGIKWLRRAAGHDFEPAFHKMADLYSVGVVLPPDMPLAIQYLRKAADAGCARAQYDLALHYASGDGEPRNEGETPVALLQKSVAGGHNPALLALANRYRTGLGVPLDYLRAIGLYQAYDESVRTQTGVVVVSSSAFRRAGNGIFRLLDEQLNPVTPINPEYAGFAMVLSDYLKATENSDAVAMAEIGRLYLAGKVVPRSEKDAYRWLLRAAQAGNESAKKALSELKLPEPVGPNF
jgi:hypothetical protein